MEYTARQQFEAFEKGIYLDPLSSYFYDWFCLDSSLRKKSEGLMKKAKKFATKMNIDLDTHYLWFKNNCPYSGNLYDDFRFADCKTGDTMWTVTPSSGFHGDGFKQCEVWGRQNNFKEAISIQKNWREFISKK